MKSFEQFLNESTGRLHEATEPFEITDTKDMRVNDATDIIAKNYPDNLTYKEIDFSKIYKNIVLESRDAIDNNRTGSKESYLGYLPKEDMFISGWDTSKSKLEESYETYDELEYDEAKPGKIYRGNLSYVIVDANGRVKVSEVAGFAGNDMYGKDGALKKLKLRHKNIIDIKVKY